MKQSKKILTDQEKELVRLLMEDCQSISDIQSKLKRLFAGTIEQMLEAEMEEHLGYNIPSKATTVARRSSLMKKRRCGLRRCPGCMSTPI